MPKLIRFPLAALMVLTSLIAHANCAPVLDALDKAWTQDRIAQYDIDRPDQPLTGRPFMVRINKDMWIDNYAGGYTHNRIAAQNPMAEALKRATEKGAAPCESFGNGVYRGQAAAKYRVGSNLVGSGVTGKVILWINKSSGLPLYHEFEQLGPGGFAWIYGDAVKEPPKK
jgi:hypothetical protein